MPKVYVTKYALTSGVLVFESVERCDDISDKMIKVGPGTHFHKPDWHDNRDDAIKRVEVMFKSHEKALAAKLSALPARYVAVMETLKSR